jgi:kynureninase
MEGPLPTTALDAPLLRDRFPILRSKTYLNTASLGAYSTTTDRRVQEFQREWSSTGAPAWYDRWMPRLDQVRATFARLIGATPGEVAILPNVSSALNVIASALDYRERPHVVTTQLDFPTISYAWATKPHARLRRLGDRRDVQVRPDAYDATFDETVAAVATSHVFYSTGAIQDVRAVAHRAHRVDAVTIVDAYHSVGQLPVDVRDLGVDVLISGGLKWLLGGPGCALMFVRRTLLADLEPRMAGWFGNERQFEFDPEAFSFRPTAQRFELGTPSLPSAFATLGGMEIVAKLGPARIRRRQNLLTTDLYEKLTDRGYRIHSPAEEKERAGILMVDVDDAQGVVARLARSRIIVDHRDGRVRVSPYFYNSVADNDRFIKALARLSPPGPATRVRRRTRP